MLVQMSDMTLAVSRNAYSLHKLVGLTALPHEKRLNSQIKSTIHHRFSLLNHEG